ncbi:hypothetical protein K438DRAFT_2045458 [Mycena galopus ATCC 62051]|nr:hypothetical protein K438DRAFT_2045458 [Mycena galopus ATCC 62051]
MGNRTPSCRRPKNRVFPREESTRKYHPFSASHHSSLSDWAVRRPKRERDILNLLEAWRPKVLEAEPPMDSYQEIPWNNKWLEQALFVGADSRTEHGYGTGLNPDGPYKHGRHGRNTGAFFIPSERQFATHVSKYEVPTFYIIRVASSSCEEANIYLAYEPVMAVTAVLFTVLSRPTFSSYLNSRESHGPYCGTPVDSTAVAVTGTGGSSRVPFNLYVRRNRVREFRDIHIPPLQLRTLSTTYEPGYAEPSLTWTKSGGAQTAYGAVTSRTTTDSSGPHPTTSGILRYTSVHILITSGQLPVNSRSTPVYLRLNPGRHPDYDQMTSGYHPFISVLFRLNIPVFSGTLRPLSDFIRPFGR